jgi:hypothetical protein
MQGVIDVPAEEPKVKALIDSMLAEFPNDVLLFSALYGDQTPGEVTYTDKAGALVVMHCGGLC